MVILIKKTLLTFAEKHPLSAAPLNNWYNIAKAANWSRLADIKKAFNNVDYIGNDGTYLILKAMITGLLR